MKNKGLAILALTAALAAGSSMAAYAAGWASEDGSWVYYDSDGYRVTYEWRRGNDNLWRYLDGSGRMAVSSWVDEYYYVDENGIMVSGKWMELDTSPNGRTDGIYWYYFNDSGKAMMDGWKKISGKWYYFDEEGMMQTGWVDDNMYFAGSDGAALVGWHKLEPPEDENDYEWEPYGDYDGKCWYYFNSSGKKYVPDEEDDGDYGEKRIDGAYYCFDEYGAMQTGWVNLEDNDDGTLEGYRFYGSDGKAVTGWYSAEPPEELAGYADDVDWFYFSRDGKPKVGPVKGEATVSDFDRINGKTYLFDELGSPVYGLIKVYSNSGMEEYTAYFFDVNDRTPLKGKEDIEEGDGNVTEYYFTSSGKGYTGVENSKLYYMGKLQKAEDGTKYQAITIPGGKTYLVNTSGKIKKNASGTKDADGTEYTTNSTGEITAVNDVAVGAGEVIGREAEEPIWWD